MNIEDIQKGQVWTSKIPSRPNITVSSVNEYNQTVYWYQQGFESHIFDLPLDMFIDQYIPPAYLLSKKIEEKKEEKKDEPEEKKEDDDENDLGLVF